MCEILIKKSISWRSLKLMTMASLRHSTWILNIWIWVQSLQYLRWVVLILILCFFNYVVRLKIQWSEVIFHFSWATNVVLISHLQIWRSRLLIFNCSHNWLLLNVWLLDFLLQGIFIGGKQSSSFSEVWIRSWSDFLFVLRFSVILESHLH